jgi:hypothetical protein
MKSIYHTCIVRFHGEFVVKGYRKNPSRKVATRKVAKCQARKMDWKTAMEDLEELNRVWESWE